MTNVRWETRFQVKLPAVSDHSCIFFCLAVTLATTFRPDYHLRATNMTLSPAAGGDECVPPVAQGGGERTTRRGSDEPAVNKRAAALLVWKTNAPEQRREEMWDWDTHTHTHRPT